MSVNHVAVMKKTETSSFKLKLAAAATTYSSIASIIISKDMSIAHGIKTLGVVGAGQMGLGIAFVAALRAKVPVLVHDRSEVQLKKSFALMDKLLAKDVAKGKIRESEAKEARERVSIVSEIKGLRDVDMVIEVSNIL